jgi:hypothetical protein
MINQDKIEMYCVTNKRLKFLENFEYNLSWVGKEKSPDNYLKCDFKDNIFFKEKYYSELTFHYWYWKNKLDVSRNNWVGFCQKRRFWIKKDVNLSNINSENIKNYLLVNSYEEWNNYQIIVCESINVNNVKKLKLIKRGYKSILKQPEILFNKEKQSIKLHFDMHHGYGNLDKAINFMKEVDRDDFRNYINKKTSFNPHIMFIAKPTILDKWFNSLFEWLFKCEEEFGFENLKGYDTGRLYAYLAERYLSFWIDKYLKKLTMPWLIYEENIS